MVRALFLMGLAACGSTTSDAIDPGPLSGQSTPGMGGDAGRAGAAAAGGSAASVAMGSGGERAMGGGGTQSPSGSGGAAASGGSSGSGGAAGLGAGGMGRDAGGIAGDLGLPRGQGGAGPPLVRTDAGIAAFGYGSPSRCANANVLLCDGFENGLDPATWSSTKPASATLVVDEMRAARGTKALHIKASGFSPVFIREKKTFPAASGLLYGRMFVWLEDDLGGGHFTFAEATGTGSKDIARIGGMFQSLGVGSDGGPSGDWTDTESKKLPKQEWLCLEFQLDGATDQFRIFWNDEERTKLRSGQNRHPAYQMPQFTNLWFGWALYTSTESQELWIDEIAIDNKPIGCVK